MRALEEILRLPEESLIRLLAEADEDPEHRRPAARSYRAQVEASGVLERLLAELGQPSPDGGVHTLGHHERILIGSRRELAGRESHHIVRAHRDGVDRFVAVHHGDPGCVPARMTVRALENCRTGRVRTHDETGVLVAELLFDTRLRAGETHLFRYGVEDGTAGVSREYVRGFGAAGGQYALQVRFDEAALPARCHRFTQHSGGGARRPAGNSSSAGTARCTSWNRGCGPGCWGSGGTGSERAVARPAGQAPVPATIRPCFTWTGSSTSGTVAGACSTSPVRASNSLPWQGHTSFVPSSFLMGHPAWVQTVLNAFSEPSSARLTTTW